MIIFIGVVTLIFSGLVALYTSKVACYTKEVARCTREYTTETRHLWEITKKFYFAKATADHVFMRYVYRIYSVPSHLGKSLDIKKKDIFEAFRDDCYRLMLEELFGGFPGIDEASIMEKLKKEGWEFKQE